MPRYEFRCRTCDGTFEVERPMSAASAPADCPHGHPDTVKLLSTVAVTGRSAGIGAGAGAGAGAAAAPGGGGCCGGGCCG